MRNPSTARRWKAKPTPQAKPATPDRPQLFTTEEAAAYIGMSVPFLMIARQKGKVGGGMPPPPHLKLGRSVKYARADLDQWLAERRVDRSAPRSNTATAVR